MSYGNREECSRLKEQHVAEALRLGGLKELQGGEYGWREPSQDLREAGDGVGRRQAPGRAGPHRPW